MSTSREKLLQKGSDPLHLGGQTPFATAEPVRAALDILRGMENPFESLARPQRLDDRFLDLHVPELLARERGQLMQIIDRYRVHEYATASDLPPTRVVTVLADRGAGKTHLLQSLAYRAH